jgi:hypothetical protein
MTVLANKSPEPSAVDITSPAWLISRSLGHTLHAMKLTYIFLLVVALCVAGHAFNPAFAVDIIGPAWLIAWMLGVQA